MIQKGTPHTFSEDDQKFVKAQAKLRVDSAIARGCRYTPYHDKTRMQAEIDTYGAEVAFCRLFGTDPELELARYLHYDTVYRGVEIDVKQIDLEKENLIKKVIELRPGEPPELYPQIYVQMQGIFPTFIYRGCARAVTLVDPSNIRPGSQPGYASFYLLNRMFLLDLDPVISELRKPLVD